MYILCSISALESLIQPTLIGKKLKQATYVQLNDQETHKYEYQVLEKVFLVPVLPEKPFFQLNKSNMKQFYDRESYLTEFSKENIIINALKNFLNIMFKKYRPKDTAK